MVIDPLENVFHSISTLILNSSCFSWFGYQLKHVAPGNRRQSWILDSTPLIPAYRYWILNSLSAELGFWIPIVCGIPDFLNCIPDSKAQDSEFFNSKSCWITESGLPYMGRNTTPSHVCQITLKPRYSTYLWICYPCNNHSFIQGDKRSK